MRLLLINPNTTRAVTERLGVAARRAAAPGTEITAVSADSDLPIITTAAESRAAVPAVLSALERHGAGHDAVVIAAYSDPGLEEARARASVPVFAIAEASMLEAAGRAKRFVVVTAGPGLVETLRQLAERYGVGDRLAGIRLLPQGLVALAASPERHLDAFRQACRAAIAEDGAGAIVIGGGPMAGLAGRLQPELPVPILDGVACAVRRAERALGPGPPTA